MRAAPKNKRRWGRRGRGISSMLTKILKNPIKKKLGKKCTKKMLQKVGNKKNT